MMIIPAVSVVVFAQSQAVHSLPVAAKADRAVENQQCLLTEGTTGIPGNLKQAAVDKLVPAAERMAWVV